MKSEIRVNFCDYLNFEFLLLILCGTHFSFFVFDSVKVTSLSAFGSQKN